MADLDFAGHNNAGGVSQEMLDLHMRQNFFIPTEQNRMTMHNAPFQAERQKDGSWRTWPSGGSGDTYVTVGVKPNPNNPELSTIRANHYIPGSYKMDGAVEPMFAAEVEKTAKGIDKALSPFGGASRTEMLKGRKEIRISGDKLEQITEKVVAARDHNIGVKAAINDVAANAGDEALGNTVNDIHDSGTVNTERELSQRDIDGFLSQELHGGSMPEADIQQARTEYASILKAPLRDNTSRANNVDGSTPIPREMFARAGIDAPEAPTRAELASANANRAGPAAPEIDPSLQAMLQTPLNSGNRTYSTGEMPIPESMIAQADAAAPTPERANASATVETPRQQSTGLGQGASLNGTTALNGGTPRPTPDTPQNGISLNGASSLNGRQPLGAPPAENAPEAAVARQPAAEAINPNATTVQPQPSADSNRAAEIARLNADDVVVKDFKPNWANSTPTPTPAHADTTIVQPAPAARETTVVQPRPSVNNTTVVHAAPNPNTTHALPESGIVVPGDANTPAITADLATKPDPLLEAQREVAAAFKPKSKANTPADVPPAATIKAASTINAPRLPKGNIASIAVGTFLAVGIASIGEVRAGTYDIGNVAEAAGEAAIPYLDSANALRAGNTSEATVAAVSTTVGLSATAVGAGIGFVLGGPPGAAIGAGVGFVGSIVADEATRLVARYGLDDKNVAASLGELAVTKGPRLVADAASYAVNKGPELVAAAAQGIANARSSILNAGTEAASSTWAWITGQDQPQQAATTVAEAPQAGTLTPTSGTQQQTADARSKKPEESQHQNIHTLGQTAALAAKGIGNELKAKNGGNDIADADGGEIVLTMQARSQENIEKQQERANDRIA